jgi:hypothetical protein
MFLNEQTVGQSETMARFETRIIYNLISEARQIVVRDSMQEEKPTAGITACCHMGVYWHFKRYQRYKQFLLTIILSWLTNIRSLFCSPFFSHIYLGRNKMLLPF